MSHSIFVKGKVKSVSSDEYGITVSFVPSDDLETEYPTNVRTFNTNVSSFFGADLSKPLNARPEHCVPVFVRCVLFKDNSKAFPQYCFPKDFKV